MRLTKPGKARRLSFLRSICRRVGHYRPGVEYRSTPGGFKSMEWNGLQIFGKQRTMKSFDDLEVRVHFKVDFSSA
jgi:hypothetical protein